jgi:hypothetical protein
MSEIVDEFFGSAADKVDETHQRSVEDMRAKVAKAKAEALKKISS